MVKELIKHSCWNVLDDSGELFTVNVSYNNDKGTTIIGLTRLVSGFYMEFDLLEFYRIFTYTPNEELK